MPSPDHYQLVLCTCPDQPTAQHIAERLVDRKLAACVNILPGVQSIYQWQGQRESTQEHLLLIKTAQSAYQQLEQAVVELHPYELPEIIAVPITGGLGSYLNWIGESVRQG